MAIGYSIITPNYIPLMGLSESINALLKAIRTITCCSTLPEEISTHLRHLQLSFNVVPFSSNILLFVHL